MPRWAQAIEARTGAPVRLTSGRATPTPCQTCGRWTLQGYDAPLIAGLAVVDPHPLDARLEAACVILGLPTWRLHGHPGSYRLSPRHEVAVPPLGALTPPGPTVTVVAKHRCTHPPLAPDPIPVTPPRIAALEEVPY